MFGCGACVRAAGRSDECTTDPIETLFRRRALGPGRLPAARTALSAGALTAGAALTRTRGASLFEDLHLLGRQDLAEFGLGLFHKFGNLFLLIFCEVQFLDRKTRDPCPPRRPHRPELPQATQCRPIAGTASWRLVCRRLSRSRLAHYCPGSGRWAFRGNFRNCRIGFRASARKQIEAKRRLAFAPESAIWLSQITPADTRHSPCRPRTEFSGRTTTLIRCRRKSCLAWPGPGRTKNKPLPHGAPRN